MAYAIGPISGCHINPAVTLGILIAREIGVKDAVLYMIAQVIGAIVAAGVILFVAQGLLLAMPHSERFRGQRLRVALARRIFARACFLAEVILTAFLVITVLGSTDLAAPVGFAGIPIGLVLVLIHLVGIPITNTSVNPARSIGPALFVGGWAVQQLWLFIVAPFIGAVLAAVIYAIIRPPVPLLTVSEAERALPSEQVERAIDAASR